MVYRSSSDFFSEDGKPLFELIAHDLHGDNPGPARKALMTVAVNYESFREDIENLNRMIRETGQGQGAIDAYVFQCEEIDTLREEKDKLADEVAFTSIPVKLINEELETLRAQLKEAKEANKNLLEEYQCALSNSAVECREMRAEIKRLKALAEIKEGP